MTPFRFSNINAVALLVLARQAWGSDKFYVSSEDAPSPFDYSKLGKLDEGYHGTQEHKLFITYDGEKISPWHQIPFLAGREPGGGLLVNFICEIPRGTTSKFEVNKEIAFNPIIQDVKNGSLRYLKYNSHVGSLVNYGAIAQTWEDPDSVHPVTNAGGDNDPIDVLQLNRRPCQPGDVMPVRILGVFGLIDGGETDWKVLAVRTDDTDDPDRANWKDASDVPKARLDDIVQWFKHYKTAEGKGVNTIANDEKVMGKFYATAIVKETHLHWQKLRCGLQNTSVADDDDAEL